MDHANKSHELCSIYISALITITLGCSYIFTTWFQRYQPIDGMLRCVTLACSLIAVHAWGWKFYRLQHTRRMTRSIDMFLRHADLNWQVFKRATPFSVIILQVVMCILAGMMLDGGDLAKLCFGALITWWATVFLLCFARTSPLTRLDLFLVKYGFWMLLVPTGFALHAVWRLKGVGY